MGIIIPDGLLGFRCCFLHNLTHEVLDCKLNDVGKATVNSMREKLTNSRHSLTGLPNTTWEAMPLKTLLDLCTMKVRVGLACNTDMVKEEHEVLPKVVTRVMPKDLVHHPYFITEHPLPFPDISTHCKIRPK